MSLSPPIRGLLHQIANDAVQACEDADSDLASPSSAIHLYLGTLMLTMTLLTRPPSAAPTPPDPNSTRTTSPPTVSPDPE
jgi:hypothetical protein